MYLAQIQFKVLDKSDSEKQSDLIYSILGYLSFDGRILGNEFAIIKKQSFFISSVQIPEKDALKHLNKLKWFKDDLDKLKEIGLSNPIIEILGKDIELSEPCSCKDSSAYILFTNFLSIQSPIKCYDCGFPMPLYKIKQEKPQQLRQVLIWQNDYKACDLLQMHCGFGERFGLKQLSDLNSGLSKQGLEICSDIKSLTTKNCYYYLYRWNGKSLNKDEERKCPKCNGEWALNEQFHELFDFRCDKCHLLSNIAFNL